MITFDVAAVHILIRRWSGELVGKELSGSEENFISWSGNGFVEWMWFGITYMGRDAVMEKGTRGSERGWRQAGSNLASNTPNRLQHIVGLTSERGWRQTGVNRRAPA